MFPDPDRKARHRENGVRAFLCDFNRGVHKLPLLIHINTQR